MNDRKNSKKRCMLSASGIKKVDYKDIDALQHFITEGGKILARRITGTTAGFQRQVNQAIKRARFMALLPFISTE